MPLIVELLPCYRRLETDHDFGTDAWHGDAGPLPIFRMPRERWGAVDRAYAAALAGLGYPWHPDHNAPDATGVSPYAINGDPLAQERVTTNDAYLEPARDRPNLVIRGDALVDRVVVVDRVARAVRVRLDGEWCEVRAREVVLAAGAVHSPAILLRSGIGPGLDVADLPVGRHLQDHPLCMVAFPLVPEALPSSPLDRHTNVCMRYSSGLAGAGRNDMMMVALNSMASAPVGMIGVWVNECWSEGVLELASDDPSVDPIIEERMLDDSRDLERMRDGIRRVLAVAASDPIQAISSGPLLASIPPPAIDAPDAEVDEWALRTAADAQHITSTARMGVSSTDSVVDLACRVHGIAGLRVVDASVLPRVPRANTHLAVLAVAERAADVLQPIDGGR